MADEPFERLVRQLREYVGLLDGAGNLVWCNDELAGRLDIDPGRVDPPGLAALSWLGSDSVPSLMRALAAVETGFTPAGERITLQASVLGRVGEPSVSCIASIQGLDTAGPERAAFIARPVEETSHETGMLASQVDFLANMSHELRTPLIAVIGYSELLVRTGTGEWKPEQKRYAADILESGRHLLEEIEDILEFAKARSGRMTLQLEAVDLETLLAGCLLVGQGLATERDLELNLVLDGGLGRIHTDPRLLRHAVLNLLSNAVKFTPEGGKIQLAARRKGPWVQIAVRDTGLGIAKAEAQRIFSAFYQVDASSRRQKGGLGLGLAIASRFVELLGGVIRLHSRVGVGSTFTLHVPATTDPSKADEPFDAPSIAPGEYGPELDSMPPGTGSSPD